MDRGKAHTDESTLQRFVSDCEKAVITHTLIRTNGDKKAAAKLLGTKKSVLEAKIHKYEIDCTQFGSEYYEEEKEK